MTLKASGSTLRDAERINLRTCKHCEQTKPDHYFGTNKSNPNYKPYRRNVCKKCQTAQLNRANRLRIYGLSAEELDKIIIRSSGKCDICCAAEDDKHTLHIDHDHATGEIRGMLCRACNVSLGYYEKGWRLPIGMSDFRYYLIKAKSIVSATRMRKASAS